jgi:(1->4)-alpha-D-glucan 1-alpha-D-glucosylmutase
LVDPDNRGGVDFAQRLERLERLAGKRGLAHFAQSAKQNVPVPFSGSQDIERLARALAARWPDPDVKLWVIARSLGLRRDWPDVFSFGQYMPLSATGPAAEHVLSFARHLDGQWVVAVVPIHFHRLRGKALSGHRETPRGLPRTNWNATKLILPEAAGSWRSELTGVVMEPQPYNGESVLDVEQLFTILPVELLVSE